MLIETPFMPSKLRAALEDIRENILIARQTVQGLTFDQFENSRIYFYAATRCLEIISEASRRLPQSFRERHPSIPWEAMRDAGNFYRHQYGNVSETRVWRTIHDSLPALLTIVETELEGLSDP